tara:strand:+ start:682 stop:1542 length:861 start_codon:yes stop_codon:yes gene_type:complete
MSPISQIYQSESPVFSFEFFPPKTASGQANLAEKLPEFLALNPGYISITYGAGGGTRDLTKSLLLSLGDQVNRVAHLTCVNHTRQDIYHILDDYKQHGISAIMALRGDFPKNEGPTLTQEIPHAVDLVTLIRERYPHMAIGVAGFPEGHPECPNRLLEMDYLKAKVDAGATYICTQLFFDNRDFFDFRDRCHLAGITCPIIPGVMNISSKKGLHRMAELAAGARYPSALLAQIQGAHSDTDIEAIGLDWTCNQVAELLKEGVPGIHFYTLNNVSHVQHIFKHLSLG